MGTKKNICSVSGNEFDSGFLFLPTGKKFEHEKDLILEIRSMGEENDISDEFILNESYNLFEYNKI